MTGRFARPLTAALLLTLSSHSVIGTGAAAQDASAKPAMWIELGTQAGPVPISDRSQPAHLLQWGDQAILIDVGDGAAQQLAKVGVMPADIDVIVISHLHFDHIGGLFGLLGMRYQASLAGASPLVIYGPPGTQAIIDNLLAAFTPATALTRMAAPTYKVHELRDGSRLDIDGIAVTVAGNSHYDLWPDAASRPVSLSYRFDTPGRSIVYTGDTGPSRALETLAAGADLLVSEIMDVESALAPIQSGRAKLTEKDEAYIRDHFTKQHLVPDEVGKLAAAAKVKSLLVTHFGGASSDPAQVPQLTKQIARHYKGPITFARDLDRF
ncbi:MBL fold metallo-hydrolase [Sphingopyxis sp. Q841]|uniref:MBL fold metallo-hydrolase n=1 Tax=Sphingopyxis sp. Q841 TaxID=3458250 RepID=UPI0040373B95